MNAILRDRKSGLLIFFLLVTALAYLPAIRGGFIWDDDAYITLNEHLKTLPGLWKMWTEFGATPQYYPLTFTTFWIEYRLWETTPMGYHIVNVVLHLCNAFLLWRVLRALSVPGAAWAAVLFAVHPVHVESVAWITERKNVLSGLFYLSSLWMYLRFAGLDDTDPNAADPESSASPRWGLYGLSWVLFMGALWSKTVTCTLPAVIVLLLWWKKDRLSWRSTFLTYPFFVAGLGMAFITGWMERFHVGALGYEWDLSALDRILIAGRALWFYLYKLLWPFPLIFTYPRWDIDAGAAWQYLFPVAFLALLFYLWARRAALGKGPLVALLFFAGTLTPALGFVNVYPMRFSFVADHFQYLASIGPLALFAALAQRLPATLRARAWPLRNAVLSLLACGLAVLTYNQSRIYKDLETLWRDTLAKNPSSWMAHYNLGTELDRQGRNTEESIHRYRAAIALKPDHIKAHFNLGNALRKRGRLAEAAAAYRQALALNPEYARAYNNLGNVLGLMQKTDAAIEAFRTAIAIDPEYANAHYNLGVHYSEQGKIHDALESFKAAVRLRPKDMQARRAMRLMLKAIDKPEEAENLGGPKRLENSEQIDKEGKAE